MFEEHEKCVSEMKTMVFWMKTVLKERKPCINRESKSDELTILLYSCHDINMKFLAIVTPPSIYQLVWIPILSNLAFKVLIPWSTTPTMSYVFVQVTMCEIKRCPSLLSVVLFETVCLGLLLEAWDPFTNTSQKRFFKLLKSTETELNFQG